jgi:hypothetical protein
MTERFQCGDNAELVSYLYEECDPADQEAIATHVSLCVACAAELAALQSARVHLASWTPPEAELGFRVVGARDQESRTGASPGAVPLDEKPMAAPLAAPSSGSWWRQPLPAWAQAAAACLLFAAGLWLGVVRGSTPGASSSVRPSDIAASGGGATVAIGAPSVNTVSANTASANTASTNTASTNIASTSSTATGATSTLAPAASRAELEALEVRFGAELTALRAETAGAMNAAPSGISETQMLVRVRALLEESEQRQQRELALRTAQVVRDFDSQRQVDLAQIQRNLGQIDGLTGAEVREQRQMLNYLMRVSEQR